MKDKLKTVFVVLLQSFALSGIVIFSVAPFSCKVTEEGIQLLTGDYTPPVLQEFYVKDSNTLELVFSEKVNITGGVVCPVIKGISDSSESSGNEELSPSLKAACGKEGSIPVTINAGEKDNIVNVKLSCDMEIGQEYEVYGAVKDLTGNELTFALPFTGYNSREAQIIMTEVQTVSVNQTTKEKQAGTARNEFVEFLCLKGGNLAGLEFCSGYDGEEKKYKFPAIEVYAGEIFLVHLRVRGEGCVSEDGDDLSLAWAGYTDSAVRDLWSDSTATAIGNKTDVLIVRSRTTGRLCDALMFRDESVLSWSKTMPDYSLLIDESGIYSSGDIENATITTGMTDSKTLYRINAAEILERIKAGEEIEYPVKADIESWSIGAETHGYLPEKDLLL